MASKLSLLTATCSMLCTMLGGGVIMLPQAVGDLGWLQAIFFIPGIAAICYFTLILLSKLAGKLEVTGLGIPLTYYNIIEQKSKAMAIALDISLVLQGIGSCISFLRAITLFVPLFVDLRMGSSSIYLAVAYIVPLTALSMLKSLSGLIYMNIFSIGSITYITGLLLYYSTLVHLIDPGAIAIETEMVGYDYYSAIGILLFALGCHQNIVQVYSELETRTQTQIKKVAAITVTVGAIVYGIVGFAGYSIVGAGIKSAILISLLDPKSPIYQYITTQTWDKNAVFIKISLAAFTMIMIGAYPIQMMAIKEAGINLAAKLGKSRGFLQTKAHQDIGKYVIAIIVGMIALTSTLLQVDYGLIVAILGATASNLVVYIFPSIIYILVVRKFDLMTSFSGATAVFGISIMFYLLVMIFQPLLTTSVGVH